jgi:prepilin-type N-terminal cleavage/methylation domain-containing protein
MRKSAQGFTMIELLIVMAIIALISIAVMVILQPMEQLKKARDKARLGDARELLTAYDRYFTSYQRYPWDESTVAFANKPGVMIAVQPGYVADTDNSWYLIEMNEIKPNFFTRTALRNNELVVSMSASGNESVCFEPESKSGRSGGMAPIKTRFNTVPSPTHDCDLAYGSSTECFVCLPF